MNFELKVGTPVRLNGRLHGIIKNIGPPEEMPSWESWNADEEIKEKLLASCRSHGITLCALVAIDEYLFAIFLQEGRWRALWGDPVELEFWVPGREPLVN